MITNDNGNDNGEMITGTDTQVFGVTWGTDTVYL